MKNVVNFHSFKELDELPEGNQGTIEALQEIVRPNRKGDKVMSLKDDEKGFYYKLEIIVCMLAFLFFAIADYNRANFLMLFLIFHRLLKDK